MCSNEQMRFDEFIRLIDLVINNLKLGKINQMNSSKTDCIFEDSALVEGIEEFK